MGGALTILPGTRRGTAARSGVVEGLAQRRNVRDHGLHVAQYIAGRHAEGMVTLGHQPLVACLIPGGVAAAGSTMLRMVPLPVPGRISL